MVRGGKRTRNQKNSAVSSKNEKDTQCIRGIYEHTDRVYIGVAFARSRVMVLRASRVI